MSMFSGARYRNAADNSSAERGYPSGMPSVPPPSGHRHSADAETSDFILESLSGAWKGIRKQSKQPCGTFWWHALRPSCGPLSVSMLASVVRLEPTVCEILAKSMAVAGHRKSARGRADLPFPGTGPRLPLTARRLLQSTFCCLRSRYEDVVIRNLVRTKGRSHRGTSTDGTRASRLHRFRLRTVSTGATRPCRVSAHLCGILGLWAAPSTSGLSRRE